MPSHSGRNLRPIGRFDARVAGPSRHCTAHAACDTGTLQQGAGMYSRPSACLLRMLAVTWMR